MCKGNIYQRRDGRWEGRIYVGKDKRGKRKFRSFYGKTHEEAKLKLIVSQQHDKNDYSITEMTVNELFYEWFKAISPRLKESTCSNYHMKAVKHLLPFFGNKKCCQIKSKTVSGFIEEKLNSGLSVRYVSDIIVLLKSMFKYANREYNIRNVLDGIIMPKKIKPDIKIFSKNEQNKLEEYITNQSSLTSIGILLAMYMGLRIGELCALQWKDIDFEKRILTVRRTLQRIQSHDSKNKTKLILTEPKSCCSKREIPIPEKLLQKLSEFQRKGTNFVLSGLDKPIEPRTMQYRFSKILKKAGLTPIHFHSLRHLFATNCIALGFDIKTLSEILGHSSVNITLNQYVHSSMDLKRACMDLFSNRI